MFAFSQCGVTWKRDHIELRKLRRKQERKMKELARLLEEENALAATKIAEKSTQFAATHVRLIENSQAIKTNSISLKPAGWVAPVVDRYSANRVEPSKDKLYDLKQKMKEKKDLIKSIMANSEDIGTEEQRLVEVQREKMSRREERERERKEAEAGLKQMRCTRNNNNNNNNNQNNAPQHKLKFKAFSIEEPPPAPLQKKESGKASGKERKRKLDYVVEGGTKAASRIDMDEGKKDKVGITITLKEGEYIHVVRADGVLWTEDGPQVITLDTSESIMACCHNRPHGSLLTFSDVELPPTSFDIDLPPPSTTSSSFTFDFPATYSPPTTSACCPEFPPSSSLEFTFSACMMMETKTLLAEPPSSLFY